MDEQMRLCALSHLPTLVQFYNLVNETLEYKITQNEASTMTVPQCIEKLEKEGGPQVADTVLALRNSWADFKVAWSGILIIYFFSSLPPSLPCPRSFLSDPFSPVFNSILPL